MSVQCVGLLKGIRHWTWLRQLSAVPTRIVSEMLKAADETETMWMTDVCNAVMMDGKIPEDWCRCWMETIYTENGDFLTCGSYRPQGH